MADSDTTFEADEPEGPAEGVQLVLNLDGFEGPIDLLLTLARDQKVDLARISILALAEQYIGFIQAAKRLELELAADYLVMAAWLAYLKSRLLLPKQDQGDDEPTGEEMAEALAFQLRRLEAMRKVGTRLFAREQLGRDVFGRGAPEGLRIITHPLYEGSLYELLQAYGTVCRRGKVEPLQIEPAGLFSTEDLLQRMIGAIAEGPEWTMLMSYLPPDLQDGLIRRSAMAAALTAGLELVRSGRAELRQDQPFGPIYVRGRRAARRPAIVADET